MNTGTIQDAQEATLLPDVHKVSANQVGDTGRATGKRGEQPVSSRSERRGFFHFIAELRRRRVCRAITMYSIAMWLVCQIVDVLSPALELPEWTLRFVILLGLLGLPVALLFSWLFEITPNGLRIESAAASGCSGVRVAGPRRPLDKFIDCSLLLAALVIGVQLATDVISTESYAAPSIQQKIAVVPFRVASGNDAVRLSEGLVIELQHALAGQTHLTVIAGRDPYLTAGSLSLTGAVAVGESVIRVTATMIDNDTGALTWSRVFERPRNDSQIVPAEFAKKIVAALPGEFQVASAAEPDNAT